MKTSYIASLLLAGSSLFFTACSEDTAPADATQQDHSISFAPYVGQTRASVATIDTLKKQGFRVWIAHNSGDTFHPATDNTSYLYNEDVQFSMPLDAWDYTNKRFWPTDEAKLSFFALTNGGEFLSTTHAKADAGAPVYTYACPAAFADQLDLLAAQDLDKAKTTNQIRFDFQHMLSKIAFTASANLPEHSSAVLRKVEIFYAPDKVHNQAQIDLNDMDVDAVDGSYYTGGEAISAGVLFESEEGEALGQTPIILGNESDDFLMLVPQAYEEGDIYLRISYTLDTQDSGHYSGTSPSFKEVHNDEKVDLPICINDMQQNIGWQKGSQYTYQIEISAEAVNFNGTINITNWNDPSDQAVKEIEKTAPSIYYQDEVYHITDADGLVIYRDIVNGNNTEEVQGYTNGIPTNSFAKGQLESDIDLSLVCGPTKGSWQPIGDDTDGGQSFYGQFDGQGHYIDNLYISEEKNGRGLFGNATSSSRISNIKMRGAQVTGLVYVGALIGQSSNATVTNCHFETGGLRSTSFQADRHVGVLVGALMYGTTITDCSVHIGSPTALNSDIESVGGFVGRISSAIIKNCSVYTDHDGQLNVTTKSQHAGGFAGHASGAACINCSVASVDPVQAPIHIQASHACVGGLIGNPSSQSTFVGCYSAVTSLECPNNVGYSMGYLVNSDCYGCWAYCATAPKTDAFYGSTYGEYNIYNSTFGTSQMTNKTALNEDIATYNASADADKQCVAYSAQGTYGPIVTTEIPD